MSNQNITLNVTDCFIISTLIVALFFLNGWVAEDIFITFRVIDNFVNGYGLRWNIDERVQVYTHPLWLILLTPIYAVTKNAVLTSLIACTVCTIASLIILWRFSTDKLSALLLIMLPLISSTTIRDFMISGMENCLNVLLLSGFLYILFNKIDQKKIYLLCLIAGLLLLARLDNIFIIAPVLAWIVLKHIKTLRLSLLIATQIPVILWYLFSLIYYGFLFPNTKYAKLNTGLRPEDLIPQGLRYMENFLYYDTAGALIILSAFMLFAYSFYKKRINSTITAEISTIALLMAGCVIHALYVIWIGGDMMSGRFMMNIILICIITLFILLSNLNRNVHLLLCGALIITTLIQIIFLANIVPYRDKNVTALRNVVFRERDYYKYETTVQHQFLANLTTMPVHRWIDKMKRHRHKKGVIVQRNIGMYGFYSNRNRIIVDTYALGDAFLARLPILKKEKYWRSGHYRREIPLGYIKARATGDISAMDSDMAKYYGLLREVTTGDLWSLQRIKVIFGFQTNAYDHLLKNALPILRIAAARRKAQEKAYSRRIVKITYRQP